MYNHYIPQSDGSFRRSSIPEQGRRTSRPASPSTPPSKEPEREQVPVLQQETPPLQAPPQPQKETDLNPLSFLKKMLPKELDSWDLIIIGFLLLLSGEECDDGLSPLLTIALYFLL